MPYVRIKMLLDENDRIFTELKDRLKTRTECVRQMFVEVLPNQERNDKPTVPSETAIRLQTRIDCEEFVEKLDAIYDDPAAVAQLKYLLRWFAERSPVRKDLHDRLPEFADALADNAVTNEGFAVLFGIDLEPVFREVMSANLRKKDGPIDEHGKRHKPVGWTPPDVVGVLRIQGWQQSSKVKPDEPIPYRVSETLVDNGGGMFWCPIHNVNATEDHPCVRCENAQYNGSEVDPIAEGEAALALLTKEASKVETGSHKGPTRHAVPITTDDESDLRLMKSTLSLLRNRTKEIANGSDTISLAALFKTIDEYRDAVVHEHKRQVRLERRALDDINRLLDEAGVSRAGQLTADRVRALIDQRNTKVD